MGSVSNFIEQDEITLSLKTPYKVIERLTKKEVYAENLLVKEDDCFRVDFEAWCGLKIESYWYDITKEILTLIAKHRDNKDEKAEVQFKFDWEDYHFKIVFTTKGKWEVLYEKLIPLEFIKKHPYEQKEEWS